MNNAIVTEITRIESKIRLIKAAEERGAVWSTDGRLQYWQGKLEGLRFALGVLNERDRQTISKLNEVLGVA